MIISNIIWCYKNTKTFSAGTNAFALHYKYIQSQNAIVHLKLSLQVTFLNLWTACRLTGRLYTPDILQHNTKQITKQITVHWQTLKELDYICLYKFLYEVICSAHDREISPFSSATEDLTTRVNWIRRDDRTQWGTRGDQRTSSWCGWYVLRERSPDTRCKGPWPVDDYIHLQTRVVNHYTL